MGVTVPEEVVAAEIVKETLPSQEVVINARIPSDVSDVAPNPFQRFHLIGNDLNRVLNAYPVEVKSLSEGCTILYEASVLSCYDSPVKGQPEKLMVFAKTVVC